MIGNEENYDLVKTLLRLITQTSSLESLKRSLTELQDENLQHLTTSLNIEKLQRAAKLMEDNLENDSEDSGKPLFSKRINGYWLKFLLALVRYLQTKRMSAAEELEIAEGIYATSFIRIVCLKT